jgi:hypothetical protein
MNDEVEDQPSILGTLRPEDLPKPKGLRLASSDGRLVLDWSRLRNRGVVECQVWNGDDDVA